MSVAPDFAAWLRPIVWRVRAQTAAAALPLVLAAAAIAWRLAGPGAAAAVAALGLAATAFLALRASARYDQRWLLRRLDAERPDVEDSADLLLAEPATLGLLQRLQRDRLITRLETGPAIATQPDWQPKRLVPIWGLALVTIADAIFWPRGGSAEVEALIRGEADQPPPVLVARTLRITPPGYTGLPARNAEGLSAKAPAGSTLIWRLRFAPVPESATLVFLDGRRVSLTKQNEDFVGTARLDRSALYRVVATGEARQGPLHRLDAIADAPPVVRVLVPATTLTSATPGQSRWALSFEARDDHGVRATARLRLIRAEGSGENVRFRESAMVLSGTGSPKARRFSVSLDLNALGLTPGGELVAQLSVADNKPGTAQTAQSPSLILRVPSEKMAEAAGLEGMVQRVMPAYFRSQRQIIIDIEALLKERRRLPAATFTARSNNIGADQRILRLRYGQFLGEESEGQPKAPTMADLLTSDGGAPDKVAPADKPAPKLVLPEGHDAYDGHNHGAGDRAPPVFGSDNGELAGYGHAHGDSETATLFDPETRATLGKALDAMWQAERSLRQAEPAAALPQAYAALNFIKDVQQATRIFLQRTGTNLPPIDMARRLTGKREGIAPGRRSLDGQDYPDAVPAALFASLATSSPSEADLQRLERWLAQAEVADKLSVVAAIDAVRSDPDCAPCRTTLRGAIWAAIATPPAAVLRRPAGDAAGRRYLDALATR
ncbi:hypothetical protein FHS79_001663 [Polymorphobacter multimanifer]|uniref:DUF4175 domain-containing protein n=1 Tax=Polymorphobacter multimanifer TaxID=1070431 RepID=A0A841L4A8_9SPHN|nr:DUF4175 family protein [Polymorphobacter multimanifer]MBB6227497.1 hypothetical protein [Polymorphobacter multimanifer]